MPKGILPASCHRQALLGSGCGRSRDCADARIHGSCLSSGDDDGKRRRLGAGGRSRAAPDSRVGAARRGPVPVREPCSSVEALRDGEVVVVRHVTELTQRELAYVQAYHKVAASAAGHTRCRFRNNPEADFISLAMGTIEQPKSIDEGISFFKSLEA